MRKDRAEESHVVYYLLKEGKRVYIGCAFEVAQRLQWIRRDHPDWSWDGWATTEPFSSKRKAHEFERQEIKRWQPEYNVGSTQKDHRGDNFRES